jgi:predicted glycosyltransferase
MGRRVLIAVTHLLGTGHISRATMIAAGLGHAGYEVTLVSGGVAAPTVGAGPYRFVQLPPVRVVGTDYANLLDESGAAIDQDYRARRIAELLAVLREVRPHVVITEHFPFGRRQLLAEFMALVDAAQAMEPSAFVLASIRDVMIAPARPARLAEVAERVERLFDAVLVHGDADFLPLARSWPACSPAMAAKLIHTGYIANPRPASDLGPAAASPPDGGEILVSGGGSAAAMPLFRAAIDAAPASRQEWRWRVLVGHGVAEAQFGALVARAAAGRANGRLVVERARRDFTALLAGCAASVSQAGYNTVIDLLHERRPAVVVPYDEDVDTDQILRANAMADAGLCTVCESASLTVASLLAAIEKTIGQGMPPKSTINLEGVARTVAVVDGLLAGASVGEIALGWKRHRRG